MAGWGRFKAFVEQKPAQATEIVEQPAAGLQVLFQFVQLELHDLQSLQPALRLGLCRRAEIGRDLAFSLGNRFDQQTHVLLGILDAVKRCLNGIAHWVTVHYHMKSLEERAEFNFDPFR